MRPLWLKLARLAQETDTQPGFSFMSVFIALKGYSSKNLFICSKDI